VLNLKQKKNLGVILILIGLFFPVASIPLSSAYDGQDSFSLRLVRVIWTGEIVFREGKIAVVQDRDEQLYQEFTEYRIQRKELESLSEDQIIDRFYDEKYKGLMPRVVFNLKLEKKQVVRLRDKIAVPNLYIFIGGLLMIIAGEGVRLIARRKGS
jgi:hypothetical protein